MAAFPDGGYIDVDYTQLVQSHCQDLSYLTDYLAKLTGTYNLLINSADSMNRITLAKKSDVEDAIDRAEDLGKIIDRIVDALKVETELYLVYVNIRNDFISTNFSLNDIIRSEVHHHIKVEKKKLDEDDEE